MDYIRSEDFSLQNTCVTIGKFDGVHLGHRLLLKKLAEERERNGGKSVVFTFDFSRMKKAPPEIFSGKNNLSCAEQLLQPQEQFPVQKLIYTEQEKKAILASCGVDVLIAYPFTEKTSSIEAEDFIRNILDGQLGAAFIAVGEDNHFGHNRRGDAAMLLRFREVFGYGLAVCKKVQYAGEAVSSTRIRRTILQGDMEQAEEMLGGYYHVTGVVEHGKSFGRTLGFPTINLIPPAEKLLPPNGVYMTRTTLSEGVFEGLTNVGVRPTVGEQKHPWVETCLLDYAGNCYGETVKTEFLHFERAEEKFGSVAELQNQIARDKERCRAYFGHI